MGASLHFDRLSDDRAYVYPAKFDHAIDGGLIDLVLDLGFNFKTHQRIRLKDVWVPGLLCEPVDRPRAYGAKKLIEEKLSSAVELKVISMTKLHDIYLGDVLYRTKEGGKWHSISRKLIKAGFSEKRNAS